MTSIPSLDLHGVRHDDATSIIEDWVLLWSYRIPAFTGKIITGNSTKMKTVAEGVLHKHKFDFKHMADGSILVTDNL
jgi:hypothetical protein